MLIKLVKKIENLSYYEFFILKLKLNLKNADQIVQYEEALNYYYSYMPNQIQIVNRDELINFNKKVDLVLKLLYNLRSIKIDSNLSFVWQGQYFDQKSKNRCIFYEICMILYYKFQQNLNYCLQNQHMQEIQSFLGECLFSLDFILKFLRNCTQSGSILFELCVNRLKYFQNFVLSLFCLTFFRLNEEKINELKMVQYMFTYFESFQKTRQQYIQIDDQMKFDLQQFQDFVDKYYIYFKCRLYYHFSLQCERDHENDQQKGFLGMQIKSLQILDQEFGQYKFHFKDDKANIKKFQKQVDRLQNLKQYNNNNFKQIIVEESQLELGEVFPQPNYIEKDIFTDNNDFQIEKDQVSKQSQIKICIQNTEHLLKKVLKLKNQENFKKYITTYEKQNYLKLIEIETYQDFNEYLINKINSIKEIYKGVNGQSQKLKKLIQINSKNMKETLNLKKQIQNLQQKVKIFNSNFDSDLEAFDQQHFGKLVEYILNIFKDVQVILNDNISEQKNVLNDLVKFTQNDNTYSIQLDKFLDIKDLKIKYALLKEDLDSEKQIKEEIKQSLNDLQNQISQFITKNFNTQVEELENINQFMVNVEALEDINWTMAQFSEIQKQYKTILNQSLEIFVSLELEKNYQIKTLIQYFQKNNLKQRYIKYFAPNQYNRILIQISFILKKIIQKNKLMRNLIQKILLTTILVVQINSQCNRCEDYLVETVCGQNGITYKNRCFAQCNDTIVAYQGACQRNNGPCGCPVDDEPVCDLDQVIYPNECIANCKGKVAIPSNLCDFGRLQVNDFAEDEIPLVVRGTRNGQTDIVKENRKNYNYRDVDYDDVDPANLYYGVPITDYYDGRLRDGFVGEYRKARSPAGSAS